jgi:hypothetical protein
VLGNGGWLVRAQAAAMAGDALAAVEDSTVLGVIRASTSWRISGCGTL